MCGVCGGPQCLPTSTDSCLLESDIIVADVVWRVTMLKQGKMFIKMSYTVHVVPCTGLCV